MARFCIELADAIREDGRRGVKIHFENDTPVTMLGGEPACTAAQMIGVALVEQSKAMCDDMGLVIEEVSDTRPFPAIDEPPVLRFRQ